MLLEVQDLCAGYGDVQVLWGVNLSVNRGEIVALVGSNGAGKTTLLRSLSGIVPAMSGTIRFGGSDITNTSPEDRVRQGLVHVPEGRRLFAGMTVEENILMGGFLRPPAEVRRDLERVWELFPELAVRRKQLAGTMSGGQQQMCAIARGLMAKPQVLMIDELSLGLAPVVVDRLVELLLNIARDTGVAILLVEQDVQLAFEVAARGYVLELGKIALEGSSRHLLENPEVKRAYIGV